MHNTYRKQDEHKNTTKYKHTSTYYINTYTGPTFFSKKYKYNFIDNVAYFFNHSAVNTASVSDH